MKASLALAPAKRNSIEEVASDVLDYFLRHPDAVDSLTGIARWRLLEEAVQQSVQITKNALAWLIAEGYLREVSMQGAEPVFRLNADRRSAAEKFVRAKRRKHDQ